MVQAMKPPCADCPYRPEPTHEERVEAIKVSCRELGIHILRGRYLRRGDAARVMGVDPGTITNWGCPSDGRIRKFAVGGVKGAVDIYELAKL